MGRWGLEWGRNKMTNKNALLGSSKNSNGAFLKFNLIIFIEMIKLMLTNEEISDILYLDKK